MELRHSLMHPILTAETHNFPSGVAPFPGAETGTGGRIRDIQATGRGAHTLAGISSYCVGNLMIPDHILPWENTNELYPANLAFPLDIEIEASNGASDYGNKFGEPVIAGFTRSFGQRLVTGERIEWIKPIMFTAGIGMLDDSHVNKGAPEVGMIVCKIGGPCYRIGMGGGSASSRVQGTATHADLDFNAVQRGDAEMENRMNRIIRACIELGERNPIISIHDQGAGGNGNVLKEIVDPLGAKFDLRKIPTGDPTLSVMEIWGAEYQENNAILVQEDSLPLLMQLSERENCPISPVGIITGDGKVIVEDETDGSIPFSLPLSLVLGKMPQKTFPFKTLKSIKEPLSFSVDLTISSALDRVLRLLDVGSKRFLTNKVDRSVTGLISQQQCVGPLHTPLADVAVCAQSHFGLTGVAIAIGEQPIKGLVNNSCQARMTVCEALSNLVFAKITQLNDVKASGNWMWPAKLEGEGVKMYETCKALKECLLALGPSIDGGKDSLSMAAKCPIGPDGFSQEIVKSPGQLTLTCYAPVPDITKTITPDFKLLSLLKGNIEKGEGKREGNESGFSTNILFVDLSHGKARLGGTALSTVFNQLGEETADCEDLTEFKRCFEIIQFCLNERVLLSGHDRSDGGLITTLLEMAFAGNCGFELNFSSSSSSSSSSAIGDGFSIPYLSSVSPIHFFFNEELGFIFEVLSENTEKVLNAFNSSSIPCYHIGKTKEKKEIIIHGWKREREEEDNQFKGKKEGGVKKTENEVLLHISMITLRDIWESTSFALEKYQCNVNCVVQEEAGLRKHHRTIPFSHVSYEINSINIQNIARIPISSKPVVAIIRQEGSNGDREMLSAFYSVGFNVYDVNMKDLLLGSVTVDSFQGVVFVGGFSYADVNDSAKGWAGVIKFNSTLLNQFSSFKRRKNTFSLGICNGCQLMALLGWIPFSDGILPEAREDELFPSSQQLRFIHNESSRFESRWTSVKILQSPSVLLKNMENSTLGIWVAHGEGKAYFPNPLHQQLVEKHHLAPIRYVNDLNEITQEYPYNPNGSPLGMAGICSLDGRHLAIMPHPERCFLQWQLPYDPNRYASLVGQGKGERVNHSYFADHSKDQNGELLLGPWIRLFQNAFDFCQGK
jgi:phosphoribosylformylglycinamidine synthase